MVQNLKPVVELNSEDWTELLKKYKLQNVMTSIHVQMLWYRMQRALEPEIWYEFPAPEEEGEENMAYILKQLQCSETIGLTDDGTLRPMKSVVFIGILTADQKKRCSTICRDCGRVDCPNRYSLHMGNYREPGALRYSYGYQRIFGK